MKAIPSQFQKYGETFTLTERVGDVALFTRKGENGRESFEVVRLRKYPTYEIGGATIEAHEAMPPDEAWGDEGWTLTSKADAEDKFLKVAETNPYSPVMGTPTGEARGRKRTEFELEFPAAGEQFTVKQLHEKYPDRSVPFIHLRVNEAIAEGRVKLEHRMKIPGQRGKPTNIYVTVSLDKVPAVLA